MSNVHATLPRVPGLQVEANATSITLLGLGAMLAGAGGLTVLYNLFTEGHAAFGTSSEFPWGLPIGIYVFLALTSSGLTILASLATVFGLTSFYPVVKRCIWLAIVTLIAGFAVLALELGHPFRMIWAVPLNMQWKSPMFWMGVFYSLDLALLAVKFWQMQKGDWDSPLAHLVSKAGLVVVLLASGTLGLIFGMMFMRPAWYDPMMPLYFIATGFLGAVALAAVLLKLAPASAAVKALADGTLPRLLLATLTVVLVMTVARVVTGLWSNADGLDSWSRVMGTTAFQVELWIGLVAPFVLLALSKAFAVPASLAVLVGLVAARLDLLVLGQQVPLFKGSWVRGFVEYAPSFTEWMLLPVGVGIALFLYAAGEMVLRLHDAPAKH